MKKLFAVFCIFCMGATMQAQITIINKPVKDFPDIYDLSTPLNAGITMYYFMINGKDNLWRNASAFMSESSHEKETLRAHGD